MIFWLLSFFRQVEGDREIGIRLLDKSLIKDVQVSPCHVYVSEGCLCAFPPHYIYISNCSEQSIQYASWHYIYSSICLHQEGQVCCFLHLVLRFYVERVFSNYASSQPQQQRCSSALANAFVSIRKDIHKCVSYDMINDEL